uniref:Ig-like domain-containing protein n=1 Tax=Anopheles culicifacies TaxID=139723 RepID=A0A182MFF5_9DIPT
MVRLSRQRKTISPNEFAFTQNRSTRPGHEPVVSVHLSNEDPSRVITRAEGENVTLKCRADARPPVTSFSWYKNNRRLYTLYTAEPQILTGSESLERASTKG